MPQTVKQAKKRLTDRFRHGGIDTADMDARLLVMAATGFERSDLIVRGDENLMADEEKQILVFLERRLAGEPVDSILGYREFYGRRFKVSGDVLSPRPETEGVVVAALEALKGLQAPRVLDLGTGSGAILISVLAENPLAKGIGVDISAAALGIARANAKTHHVNIRSEWLEGHWFDPVIGNFDIILSNPPYITDAAMTELSREVSAYDPEIALRGGADGLAAYKDIVAWAPDYLKPRGILIFEIGFDQGEAVSKLMRGAGFKDVRVLTDLSGHDRVVSGQWH